MIMMFWSTGMVVLAPLAFWLRHWHQLQLATALVSLPLLVYWWWVFFSFHSVFDDLFFLSLQSGPFATGVSDKVTC
jgi:hypothetical protein